MIREVLPVEWYRFKATFRQWLPGYLSLGLLLGIIGGVSVASIAPAQRTQASYSTFLASTNPSDLTVSVGSYSQGIASYNTTLGSKIAGLPDVVRNATLITPAEEGGHDSVEHISERST